MFWMFRVWVEMVVKNQLKNVYLLDASVGEELFDETIILCI